jgi:hypothetical protein
MLRRQRQGLAHVFGSIPSIGVRPRISGLGRQELELLALEGNMNHLKSALVTAAVAITANVAMAQQDPRVTITVSPAVGSESVTLSRPATNKNNLQLDTFSAFTVVIYNGAASALNRVFLDGTAIGNGTTPATYDSFVPTKSGDSCSGSGNSVHCDLLSLLPGTSTSFTVIFKTPMDGTALNLSYRGGGDEGNGGGNGCCNQSGTSTAPISLIDAATDPAFKKQASTFMRPSGFTLFTGPQAVTTSTDGWSTIVTAPPFTATSYTKASILEDNPPASCQPYVVGQGCFSSTVNLPGFSVPLPPEPIDPTKLLQITIRWDKAFFNLGKTKPEAVKLKYTGSNPLIHYPIELQLCSADKQTYGSAPSLGRPCLSVPPKILRNSDTPDKELWGDLEFNGWALENGRYEN